MGESGFWDDQDAAAKANSEYARVQRRLETYERLEADTADLDALTELAEEDPELEAELSETLAAVEAAPGRARGGAAVHRRLRRGRCARHGQRRRGRHRRPGLGRDGAADDDALGRAPRLQGRAARGQPGRGGRHQVGHVPSRRRERLRALLRREGRPPARAALAVRLGQPAPDVVRRRRGRAGGRGVGRLEIDDDDLQIDTYRASGAGGQHVNKTDSAVRITHKPSGIVVQCQNERSQSSNRATAMAMLRSKLVEAEERRRKEEIARERGEAQDVNFGSQIRSYVLHPYTMVKDHRTDFEVGNANGVLDGDLDGFVHAYLMASTKAALGSRGTRRRAAHRRAAPGAAQRAVPRRRLGLRVPRLDPLSRARAQGRRGRRSRPALRARGAGAHGRRAGRHPRHRPRAGADALPARRGAGRRGARRGAVLVPDQRRHPGQPRAGPGAGPDGRVGRGAAQLPRERGRRPGAVGRRADLRGAGVRARAGDGARRHAGGDRGGDRRAGTPRAVFIVSPTYYGMAADVAACAAVCHAAGVPLVVDQAWGPHFGFHPDVPASALELGADAVLTSTHKIVGSLTQSAMLHVAPTGRIDPDQLARMVRLTR